MSDDSADGGAPYPGAQAQRIAKLEAQLAAAKAGSPEKSSTVKRESLQVIVAGLLVFFLLSDEAHRQSLQQLTCGIPAASVATEWSDALLYTAAGQAHDAWRLLPRNQIAPLTAETQKLILAHQFPAAGCANARFLVSLGLGDNGIGSQLHIATFHLSIAIELKRVFLWGENSGSYFTDSESCSQARNFECFFRAPSSCTLKDARRPGADTVELGFETEQSGFSTGHVPAQMKRLWFERGSAGLAPNPMELKYWWRAQAVAFLARFNDVTINAIRTLRTNKSAIALSMGADSATLHPQSYLVGPGWPPTREDDIISGTQMADSFPFKRGMTSMHVRHGDKGREMTLVSDEAYFAAAEMLVMHHPMGLVRAAFISTEDPGTIAAAAEQHRGWALMWYKMPRISSKTENPGLQELPLLRGQLTRIVFMQLLMALECDAWIGTRRSNWNRCVALLHLFFLAFSSLTMFLFQIRLIDELRCIWVPKCMQPSVEVGSTVPDKSSKYDTWESYGWR